MRQNEFKTETLKAERKKTSQNLVNFERSRKKFDVRYRKIVEGRKERVQKKKEHEATIVLQCAWRMKTSKIKFEAELRAACAKVVQCALRQRWARYELLRRKQKKAFLLLRRKNRQVTM
jgi:hypothetical protein